MTETLILNMDDVQFTDTQLFTLCERNKELQIERTWKGSLIFMAPSGSDVSSHQLDLATTLNNWNRQAKLGKVFDSSGGFRLPNGAMRAPDVAWVAIERWNRLTPAERAAFAPLCPDFIVEMMSPTDRLRDTQEKMEEWIENGCRLAWLIDPKNEIVYIYHPNNQVRIVKSFDESLSGEDVLPGFVFDLKELR